jgi:hypothetical protein
MDADVDDRERQIITDAIARGYTVAQWIACVICLVFIASGLWWAGILVLVGTLFELPPQSDTALRTQTRCRSERSAW